MDAISAVTDDGTQRVRFAALDLQHGAIKHELSAAFASLLDSSAFTLGAEVERFEEEFARYCQVDHCVGVSSGTAALSLILRAYNIGPGDEVIVPAHTFIASALAVRHVGATPVLCDVKCDTALIDPAAAQAAIGPRTVAIMAVHLYGQSCEMDALSELARSKGLLLLEDAAQAHGACYRGRRTGSLGSAAAFSFYPSKNLGALGDGGAICTQDDVLAARLRRLRNLGQRAKGEHVEVGYNERLDGLQAAFLRVKLRHLDEWNAARQRHAARYRDLLDGEPVRLPVESPESPSVHHLFAARFEHRDDVGSMLGAQGIETGIHYTPAVQDHQAWKDHPLVCGDVPNADDWAATELSLPMHAELRPDEVERVCEAVRRAVSEAPSRSLQYRS